MIIPSVLFVINFASQAIQKSESDAYATIYLRRSSIKPSVLSSSYVHQHIPRCDALDRTGGGQGWVMQSDRWKRHRMSHSAPLCSHAKRFSWHQVSSVLVTPHLRGQEVKLQTLNCELLLLGKYSLNRCPESAVKPPQQIYTDLVICLFFSYF